MPKKIQRSLFQPEVVYIRRKLRYTPRWHNWFNLPDNWKKFQESEAGDFIFGKTWTFYLRIEDITPKRITTKRFPDGMLWQPAPGNFPKEIAILRILDESVRKKVENLMYSYADVGRYIQKDKFIEDLFSEISRFCGLIQLESLPEVSNE